MAAAVKSRRLPSVAALVAVAALSSLAGPAAAFGQELTGTLKKVHDAGAVTLGFRESSPPFSYRGPRGEPIGYSVDLGLAVVEAMRGEVNRPDLQVRFVPVTSESRLQAVVDGTVDLECGSTTANAERRQQVSFSPVMFVAGTKLLVKRSSPVASYRDLAGKTVVATLGTTNQAALERLNLSAHLDARVVTGRDHGDSYAQLEAGAADAFAGDDVLLAGLVAGHHAEDRYLVVGDYLSYDPYGLMFRRDDGPMEALIQRVFEELARSRELEHLYRRWFLERLPGGETLNVPMSAQLRELFRTLGAPD